MSSIDDGLINEQVTSDSVTRNQRDFLKCHRCRHDGKKCDSGGRDWESKREKCLRCSRLGHECGPSERKSNRQKSLISTAYNDRHTLPAVVDQARVFVSGQRPQSRTSGVKRPMVPWAVDDDMQPFSRLATIIASQQVLFRCRSDLWTLVPSIGPADLQKHDDRLTNITSILDDDFQSIAAEISSQLGTSTNSNKETLEWKLSAFSCQKRTLQQQRELLTQNRGAATVLNAKAESPETLTSRLPSHVSSYTRDFA